ncbi:uncharacterized protein LOC113217293 [Frankliniella occidentalis]|uniref:Uncharacterized protein LOC113217293 n=1 Tax=Frankliniella occidentalis TaxID=133901 RepID=A0A9C6XCN0_FRAOC|nr:uncharacterized protein LOC113217293 [Frankliniella occidentalis]
MSLILIALALVSQAGIHGKAFNSVLGPYISYGERFYMCEEPNNRPLAWTWYLRATHFNPLKPNELQRLTGNLTIADVPFDNSLWAKVIADVRSNNQWKENAFIFRFKGAYRSLKQNIPGFYERVLKRGEDIDARLFKTVSNYFSGTF